MQRPCELQMGRDSAQEGLSRSGGWRDSRLPAKTHHSCGVKAPMTCGLEAEDGLVKKGVQETCWRLSGRE
jgi:hypothetical protein